MTRPIRSLPGDVVPVAPHSTKLLQNLWTVAAAVGPCPTGLASEWVLLPELFLWSEVCHLFEGGSGGGKWRYRVSLKDVGSDSEPLYSVWVATRGSVDFRPDAFPPEEPTGTPSDGPRLPLSAKRAR